MRVRRLAMVFGLAFAWSAAACSQTKAPAPHAGSSAARTEDCAGGHGEGPDDARRRLHREQASRGRDVYLSSCRSCHTPQSHTGATFNKWWRGKHL